MKKVFLILLTVLFSQTNSAQEASTTTDIPVYSAAIIDLMPEFPGGNKAFAAYTQRHYKLPNVKLLKGKVLVEFVVNLEGSIEDIKVIRDLGFGTAEEAIRLMQNCPKWSPGIFDGKPVRVKYCLPISIDIH